MAENVNNLDIGEQAEQQEEQVETLDGKKNDESDALFDFLNWSCDDVADWIEQLGFPYYRDCFHSNFINGRKLVLVTASTLPNLGVHNFDHIKVITKAIRELLQLEDPEWNRSISRPPRNHLGMFMEQKSMTGEAKDNLNYSHFKAEFPEKMWRPPLSNHTMLLPHS